MMSVDKIVSQYYVYVHNYIYQNEIYKLLYYPLSKLYSHYDVIYNNTKIRVHLLAYIDCRCCI